MHYKGYSNTSGTWVIIIGGILLIAGLLFGCGGSTPEEPQKPLLPADNNYLKAESARLVDDHVKTLLVSPGTADFAGIREKNFIRMNDTAWVVEGWVDSQNALGATIRTKYSAMMEYHKSSDSFDMYGFETH